MARAMLGTEIYEKLVSAGEELLGGTDTQITLRDVEEKAGVPAGKSSMFFDTEADLAGILVDRCYRRTLLGCASAMSDRSLDYTQRISAGIEYVRGEAEKLDRIRSLADGEASVKSRIVTYVDACETLKDALQDVFADMAAKGVFSGDPAVKAAYIAYGLLGLHWLDCPETVKAEMFRDCLLSMLPVVESRKAG